MSQQASIAVGDLVWVRPGLGSHEEPATVLEVGCEYDVGNEDSDGEEVVTKTDGIRCVFHISQYKAIFPPTSVRSFEDDSTGISGRKRRTRSAKTATTSSSSSSSSFETKRTPRRRTVTPSPTTPSKTTDDSKTTTSESPYFASAKDAEEEVGMDCEVLHAADDRDTEETPSTKKPNASIKVRDLVWVRPGLGPHEETGKVLEVDCEYDVGNEDDDGEEVVTKRDGIRCVLDVSNRKAIFPPTSVRSFEDNQTGVSGRKKRTRSAKATKTTPPASQTKRTQRQRTVTPSPATPSKTTANESKSTETRSPYFKDTEEEKEEEGSDFVVEDSDNPPRDVDLAKVDAEPKGAKAKTRTYSATKKKGRATVLFNQSRESGDMAPATVADKESAKRRKITKLRAKSVVSGRAAKRPTEPTEGISDEDDDDDDDDELLSTLKKVHKKVSKASAKTSSRAATKGPKTKVFKKATEVAMEGSSSSSDYDDDDDRYRAFNVSYSPTGRATCRTCDKKIPKGCIRISHVPLFRGKAGFTEYRHLNCAVFAEEVKTMLHVGGWRQLSKSDRRLLAARVEDSKEELQKEMEELQPDELVPVVYQGELRPSPPGLTANLLPFQVEGVSWMYQQEQQYNGGILADEMGMGKTLQSITMILDNRPKLQHSKPGTKHPPSCQDVNERVAEERLWTESANQWRHEMKMLNIAKSLQPKKGGGARAGTLVVCPVIALLQWKSEIEKFSENGCLTIGVYHGPNRSTEMPREMMLKYDIVLTTYQVVEAEFRKMVSPNKVKCPNCGGKFKIDKLRLHLKYFCGEGAQRTEAQARQRSNRDRNAGSRSPPKKPATTKMVKSKQKTMQKKTKKTPPARKKTTVHVKKVSGYDSESDLSFEEEPLPKRGRRSSALSASQKMAKSRKDWGGSDEDGSNSYAETGSGSDSDSSSDSDSDSDRSVATPPPRKKKRVVVMEEDSESEDELAAARAMQQTALQCIPVAKPKSEKKKKLVPKKRGLKKGKPQKRDSDDDDKEDDELLSSLEMDRLVEEAMQGSQMSVMHSCCWWRIVLDEAHMIKRRSTQTANAAFALIGVHRWCLSGTPLQNRVGDFYSLIRFLRIDPMAHYFCRAKGCDCKSLHYRMMNGKCQGCGHGSVQHYSHFNKHVLNPIQRAGYTGDGRRAMFTLKNEVLDKFLLRRTKETRAEDMNLPPRLVSIRYLRLHPIEEDFYNALYTKTKSSFNDYVADGTLLNNYAHIFDLLMRMRQAVDHPYLVVYSKKDFQKNSSATVANGSTTCELCHEPPQERVVSSCCGAGFCVGCVRDYMSLNTGDGGIPCPSCRNPFSIDLTQPTTCDVQDKSAGKGQSMDENVPSLKEMSHVPSGSILRRINLAEFATSTKIEALTEELIQMRNSSPGSKAIVFSQFVNMLDLIRWRLHSDPCLARLGLGVRALHGAMNVKARDQSLRDFREDSSVRVLLVSLKAGSVALNLTVANYIYLMDPWWNPAAEMQAIDRTHRLGQYRPIKAVRFIAEDTVEERILQLQEKKRLVFDGTIGRDAGSLQKLTVEDMKAMFA